MKYTLAIAVINNNTRRRVGVVYAAEVEASTPYAAEQKFEREFAIDNPNETAKVINVRAVRP